MAGPRSGPRAFEVRPRLGLACSLVVKQSFLRASSSGSPPGGASTSCLLAHLDALRLHDALQQLVGGTKAGRQGRCFERDSRYWPSDAPFRQPDWTACLSRIHPPATSQPQEGIQAAPAWRPTKRMPRPVIVPWRRFSGARSAPRAGSVAEPASAIWRNRGARRVQPHGRPCGSWPGRRRAARGRPQRGSCGSPFSPSPAVSR
jgi:hypothetical protein